jgi:hypothetical protein
MSSNPEFHPLLRFGSDVEALRERRARREHQRKLALEHRQQELLEQTSAWKSAEARICIWERRHGLTLPSDPAHKLVTLIARATCLRPEDVTEVQRKRKSNPSR